MSYKAICLTICLILSFTAQLNLIPDRNNHLTVTNPTNANNGLVLNFRFQFPNATPNTIGPDSVSSPGLYYRQFIGVAFPPSVGTADLGLDQLLNGSPKYSCALTDGTNTYTVSPVVSTASPIVATLVAESNIAYCRLDDVSANTPLSINPGVTYTLTITLTSVKVASTQYLRQVSLFTSTSNNPEKMIIDSLPVWGSVALYNDWTAFTPKALDISSISTTVTQGPSAAANSGNTIYPYNQFDVTLTLKANTFISAADHVIVINYPSLTVAPATSILTNAAAASDPLQVALAGNLAIQAFGSSALTITGIAEDLVPNRQFQIVLKGWKALDTDIGTARAIQVVVYYKNTYSVLSWVSSNIFNIQSASLTLTVNHPEFWDIYRNGAWPFAFTFKTNSDITSSTGSYVLIQQTNTLTEGTAIGNSVTFIASTCDFSGNNSSFNNSFGKRPSCYPLRVNNLSYANASTTIPFLGSGIFFYMPGNISSSTTYYVNVWAFADNCGGTNNYNPTASSTSGYVVPAFRITIYKYLDPTQLNEARLSTISTTLSTNGQQTLGQSAATSFSGKCWNTFIQSVDAAAWNTIGFDQWTLADLKTMTATTSTILFLYKEVFDWQILNASSNTNFADIQANYAAFTENFVYTSNSAALLPNSSYFAIRMPLTKLQAASTIPLSLIYPGNVYNYSNTPGEYPGKLYVQFPAAWFTTGDGYKTVATGSTTLGCYLSWGASFGTGIATVTANAGTQKVLTPAFSTNNYIRYSTVTADAPFLIDTASSLLPPDNATGAAAGNNLRLVSTFTAGGATPAGFNYLGDQVAAALAAAADYVSVSYYSTCVKWNNSLPTITSLYTYIDIQFQWRYMAANGAGVGVPISNVRYIKLFPEGGVFNDFAKAPVASTGSTTNPYINHKVFTANGNDAVCLIELLGSSLTNLSDNNSNTLIVWIMFGTLLETDYTDASSLYPVANLNSSVSAYGLQSTAPIGQENRLWLPDNSVGAAPALANTQTLRLSNILTFVNGGYNHATYAPVPAQAANRFAYHFFMGSIIYFTGVVSNNLLPTTIASTGSLLIPYYCPIFNARFNTGTAIASLKYTFSFPTVVAAWASVSAFNSYGSINRYVNYVDGAAAPNQFTVMLSQYNATSPANLSPLKGLGTLGTNSAVMVVGTSNGALLRWNAYTNTNINNLYIYTGTMQGALAAAMTCSGFSFFLHSSVSFDTTVSFNVGIANGSSGFFNGSKTFYILGKSFSRAAYYGSGSASGTLPAIGVNAATANLNNMVVQTASSYPTSTLYITGVKRQTADQFITSGRLVLNDRVAFFCTSLMPFDYHYITNYTSVVSTGFNVNNFIVDWQPDTTTSWLSPSVSFDISEIYKNDIASNLKAVLSPPVSVPAGSQFQFTAATNAITTNTVCGLVYSTSTFVNECTVSSGTATCTTPVTGTSFTVCCYNLQLTDPLALSSLTSVFPANSAVTGLSSYISSGAIYSAANQIGGAINPYSFVTNNANAVDVIGTLSAKITNIVYSQVNQESGLGKVTFAVTLPRAATRDMKISLAGDLSSALIPGNIPRCVASFQNVGVYGSTWDNGDALIDTCSTGNFSSSVPIVVTTKRIVYKCGVTFSKVLYINLWPVSVTNWSSTTITPTFKVNMTLNSGDPIAMNTSNFTMTLQSPVSAKPGFVGQWDNLCTVASVTPRLPGEIADYTFNFDLTTNKAALTNNSPNEVTIFWPYQYFGSYIKNVLCYSNGTLLDCSFTDEGILNVRFAQSLAVGTGQPTSIIVSGVVNPAIDVDYSFPCTVNNTVFSSGVRTNLITGSGKLAGGINLSAVTAMGNLRFFAITPQVLDKNPRATTTYTFRVAFDNAINQTALPITINNTPVIHVSFPSDFNLAWYTNKPTVVINEWTNNANNVISQTATIAPATVTQSGNRLTITLTQTTYTFATTWRYWDIVVSNVVNPADTTLNSLGVPPTQSSRPFYITLTNSNLTAVYKTYHNINTYFSDALTTPVNAFLTHTRGNTYVFDGTKWVVDIYSNVNQLNRLLLRPGRFMAANFNVKSSTTLSSIAPWVTNITLNDAVFKTSATTYALATAFYQPLSFYIGCACGTAPGFYLINFTSSDTTNFAPLSPVVITVDSSVLASISFATPPAIPAAGSTWISIILSDPNFDKLTVNWTAAANSKNDATATISNVTIPVGTITPTSSGSGSSVLSPIYAEFGITSTSTTLPAQVFTTTDPSSCYTFGTANTISFTITGQTAIIPSGLNLTPYFVYTNAANDSTVTNKNSIKFLFTPFAAPIYIYCALACINQAYPTDANIITPVAPASPLLQYYRNVINTKTPLSIVFDNLVRGQVYHLRCLVQSTEFTTTLRTNSNVNFENYVSTGATNSTTVLISPAAPVTTQCAQWQFLAEPGVEVRQVMLNYCQNLFSSAGYFLNGCITCTTQDIPYTIPGIALPTNIACVAASSKNKLRFLQTAIDAGSTATTTLGSATATICPVANPICTTDVSSNKAYSAIFAQLTTSLNTAALFQTNLNVINVRLNTTTPIVTTSDTTAPDITKLTITVTTPTDLTGALSFTAAYPTPVKCYWQVSANAATAAPSFASLMTCTGPWCGSVSIGVSPTTISTPAKNLQAFTASTQYNIFVGCTNNVPNAQLQSAVAAAGKFTTITPTPPPSSSTVCVPTATTTCGSNFFTVSLISIMILFGLLFN